MSKSTFLIATMLLPSLCFSQSQRWAVEVNIGAIYNAFENFDVHVIDENGLTETKLFPDEDRLMLGMLLFGAGASYEVKSWFRPYISLAYGPERLASANYSTGIRERHLFSQWEVSAQARFDLLYKDDYEELNFWLGLNYGQIRNKVERSLSNTAEESLVNRRIAYWRPTFGIEWRDYVIANFGYFLNLSFSPKMNLSTNEISVEKYRRNGQALAIEGEEIVPGENGVENENHKLIFLQLTLGLTYQF